MCDTIARTGGRGNNAVTIKSRSGPWGAICLSVILAGCTTPEFVDPAASADHPANPAAAEAPAPKPSTTLTISGDRDETTGMPQTGQHHGGMHQRHMHHGGQSKNPDHATKGHHHGHGMAK